MKKKAALYNPFLDVLGGGERHILSILKVLEDENYDLSVFWNKNLSQSISAKLDISFNNLQFLPDLKNKKAIEKLSVLNNFDIFLFVTDGSYFFSSAKKNYIFAMVPQKSLYEMSTLNKLKTKNFSFISNSQYTQKQLKTWGIHSDVIYPYISEEILKIRGDEIRKEKIILSVGRFFPHLHSKRQDVAIEWFKKLQQSAKFKDYKLVLLGSLKEEDTEYFKQLQSMAQGNRRIEFYPNVTFGELINWYKKAQFYWHMAGIDVDANKSPENVEHLGITPLEAMAAGCITCAYNMGGPQEIIQNNQTGFLYNNQEELFTKMKEIVNDEKKQTEMRKEAKQYVANNFSYEVFRKRVKEIINS